MTVSFSFLKAMFAKTFWEALNKFYLYNYNRDPDFEEFLDKLADPGFWMMLLSVFIVIGDIAILVVFYKLEKQEAMIKTMPIRRMRARIIEKQQLPLDAVVTSATLIWIMVELENGQRLRLRTKAQSGLVTGDAGYMSWQGDRVRDFEVDKKETVN